MTNPAYRFHIGQFDCRVIQVGGGPRALTSFLATVPAEELEQAAREENIDPNAVDFSLNILALKSGSQTILVDTGLPPGMSDLPGALQAEGIDPAAVNLVIITHGHRDHVGGILNAGGEFNYPNARYAIWKSEWELETEESRLAEAENANAPIWKALLAHRDRVKLVGGGAEEAEIMPGVCAVPAPGHTIGHIAVQLEDAGERLLHIVDAAHSVVQMPHPNWSPGFDYDGKQSAVTREKLFRRAARDRSLVLAYHLAHPGLGHVVERDGELHWETLW